MKVQNWLMKSEPEVFSIDDLQQQRTTLWEGVRNYQARNFMVKDMKIGDQVFFYHSNAEPPGIAGIAEVSSLAVPDPSQFDRKSDYFDPQATKASPRWFCVTIRFVKKFDLLLPLERLKAEPALKGLLLLQKGQRLSIQPVEESHFRKICQLAGQS